jgi:ABC-type Fe3+-siderophore transport system permease subunit
VSDQIIWQIRAPRIIGAVILGAVLAIAGVLAQGSTNNPLADPAFLGTTAGAALGVVIGVLTNAVNIASIGSIAWATCGALLATLLTFWLARNALQLIIIGIANEPIVIPNDMAFTYMRTQIMGHYGSEARHVRELIEFTRDGRLDLSHSVTQVLPLEQAGQALEILANKIGNPIRIVLKP